MADPLDLFAHIQFGGIEVDQLPGEPEHLSLAQAHEEDQDKCCVERLVQATLGVHQAEGDLAPYCMPSYVEMEAGASWVRLNAADSAIPVFADSRAQGKQR